MSKVDTSLQVWLGNVPAGASPSDVKAQIASHGYGRPHFVKVLKSKHAGVKLMNCIATMPSAESATDLLHGYVTWSNGKHAVIRSAFQDKKPSKGESADEAGVRWKRDQLVRQLAQIDAASSSGEEAKGQHGPWHRSTGSASSSLQSSGPEADKSVDTLLKAEIDKLKTNMTIPVATKKEVKEEDQEALQQICSNVAQPVPHGPVSSPPPHTHRTSPYLLSQSPHVNPYLLSPEPPMKGSIARETWDELSPVSPLSGEFSEV